MNPCTGNRTLRFAAGHPCSGCSDYAAWNRFESLVVGLPLSGLQAGESRRDCWKVGRSKRILLELIVR
jgi:hypothetical protein